MNEKMNEIMARAKEIEMMMDTPTFDEICAEVRASLPPSKYMRARYMRNCSGLI
jgi:hypothetical protein